MFSRFQACLIFFNTLALLANTGCSVQLGEDLYEKGQVSKNEFNYQGNGGGECLSGYNEILNRYFEGNSNVSEISQIIDCFSNSLNVFSRFATGNKSEKYTTEELINFLETFMMKKGQKIPPKIMYELMVIKSAFLGGSPDYLTHEEIFRVIEFLGLVKQEAIRLMSHFPIGFDGIVSKTNTEVNLLVHEFSLSARRFSQAIKQWAKPYSFQQLEKFLDALDEPQLVSVEFKTEVASSSITSGAHYLKKYLKLFQKLKPLILSTSPDSIFPEDWERILYFYAKSMGIYYRYQHLSENYSYWFVGEANTQVGYLIEDIIEVARGMLDNFPNGVIPFELIKPVVTELGKVKSFPFNIKAESLNESLEPFFTRLAAGSLMGDEGRKASGVTAAIVNRLYDELKELVDSNEYINKVFEGLYQRFPGQEKFRKEQIFLFPIEDIEGHENWTQAAIQRMRVLVSEHPFLHQEDNWIITLSDATLRKNQEYSLFHFLHLNWIRSFYKAIVQGYAEDEKRAQNATGLFVKEFERAYIDFLSLGVDIKIFDKNDANKIMKKISEGYPKDTIEVSSARARFLEGDLFTFKANGDNFLSLEEGTELFDLLFSAKRFGDWMYHGFLSECKIEDAYLREKITEDPLMSLYTEEKINQLYGKNLVSFVCFKERIKKDPRKWLKNFPGFLEFWNSAHDSLRDELLTDMLKAARGENRINWLSQQDFSYIAAVIQYIEVIMLRFDQNKDQVITDIEMEPMFDVFKKVIEKVAKTILTQPDRSKPKEVQAYNEKLFQVFQLYLYYGRAPTTWEWLRWDSWWFVGPESIKADRAKALKIFSSFRQAVH